MNSAVPSFFKQGIPQLIVAFRYNQLGNFQGLITKYTNSKYTLLKDRNLETHYSEQCLQSVLKKALQEAMIKKQVTLDWLRYSYATHLIESRTYLRIIQESLAHHTSKTTEIYTPVSIKSLQQIRSPFDD